MRSYALIYFYMAGSRTVDAKPDWAFPLPNATPRRGTWIIHRDSALQEKKKAK